MRNGLDRNLENDDGRNCTVIANTCLPVNTCRLAVEMQRLASVASRYRKDRSSMGRSCVALRLVSLDAVSVD